MERPSAPSALRQSIRTERPRASAINGTENSPKNPIDMAKKKYKFTFRYVDPESLFSVFSEQEILAENLIAAIDIFEAEHGNISFIV